MARITSEDAVNAIGNRFDLVLVAAMRARELARGHHRLVDSKNGNAVTALKEIEAGKVGRDYLDRLQKRK